MGDEYENLPETAGPAVHMVAGAAAGILEHTALYPFDVLKTRIQRISSNPEMRYVGTVDCARKVYAAEGPRAFFRGMRAVVLGAGPAHALYFSAYEKSRVFFNAKDRPNSGGAAAAVCATFAHDSFMNPIEVVKQRMQINREFTGVSQCIYHIWKHEGVFAFYRSFTTSLMMNIPFHSVYLVLYDKTSRYLNPTNVYSPTTHMCAGAFAGAVASTITTPFDVCKTYLNTTVDDRHYRRSALHLINGISYAGRNIYQQAGMRGFIRGWGARVIFTTPAGAISWAVYESFKHLLRDPTEEGGLDNPSLSSTVDSISSSIGNLAKVHAEEVPPTSPQTATRNMKQPQTVVDHHVCAFDIKSDI